MRYGRALVALDGSAGSNRTLEWLRRIEPDAELILLRVIEPTVASTQPYLLDPVGPFANAAEAYLARTAESIHPAPRTIVRIGTPWVHILEVARQEHCNLIVAATRGGSPWRRRIFGGTVERLLDHTGVPLLVVPSRLEASSAPDRIRRICVPVDGSPTAESTARWVASLARRLGARIELIDTRVRAIDPGPAEMVAAHAGTVTGETSHMKQIRVIARSIERSGVATDLVPASGPSTEPLMQAAKRLDVDLFAISTRNRGSIERLLFGSDASRLIQESFAPVLAIPQEIP